MTWLKWLVILLALSEAGWMAYDGWHAWRTGDYVTPRTGAHAGQLGPWANVVSAAGIEPRSPLVKTIFVVYGLAWLAIIACYALGYGWTRTAMFASAAGTLWYLPVGTLTSLLIMALLWFQK